MERITLDQKWWLEKVLNSAVFQSAQGDALVLKHLAEKTMTGKPVEAAVAAAALYKDAPNPANNLSGAATRIRKRLATYYATEGAEDPVRLVLLGRRFHVFVEESLQPPSAKPAADDEEADPEAVGAYLRDLWNATRYIRISNLRTGDGSAISYPIDELYTPLTSVLARPSGQEGVDSQGEERPPEHFREAGTAKSVPLQEALNKPRLVLVGDPGAGKTTFLRRIAFEACHYHPLRARTPEWRVKRLLPAAPVFPILIRASELAAKLPSDNAAAQAGRLLDFLGAAYPGLGADYFRRRMKQGCLLLVDSLDEVPGKDQRGKVKDLLVAVASDQAYTATKIVATSRPGVFGGVTQIEGFDRVDIAPLDEEGRKEFALRWGRAVYPEDANSASKLTDKLLAEIRSKKEIGRMAENPVMLTALACLHFTSAKLPEQRSELYHSVLEWLAKQRAKPGRDHYRLLALLRKLAYAMHTDEGGRRTAIESGKAAAILAPRFQEQRDPSKRREEAVRFLDEEEISSGIIVNDGATLRFWHATFQEALAAQELALDPGAREQQLFQSGKWHNPEWRETLALLAGELAKIDHERVSGFLEKLLQSPGGEEAEEAVKLRFRCVGLIDALLRDLAAWNYALPEALEFAYRKMLHELQIFDGSWARKIPFEDRLDAAEALGRSGDHRLARQEENWVEIKGAKLKMGKYPVTVAEYRNFVDAGGYEQKEHWDAGGYGAFSQPEDWESQAGHPNWPVTGVNWFEASAFCAWKSAQAGRKIRLPSDAEWLLAATAGRKQVNYPWGKDEPDEYKANYWHDRPGSPKHPTPVGLYPEGATPEGIEDMAGNVWEWSQDWYEPDKYRIVRGGSWSGLPQFLQVSGRDWSQPEVRNDGLGFRVVREEKIP